MNTHGSQTEKKELYLIPVSAKLWEENRQFAKCGNQVPGKGCEDLTHMASETNAAFLLAVQKAHQLCIKGESTPEPPPQEVTVPALPARSDTSQAANADYNQQC